MASAVFGGDNNVGPIELRIEQVRRRNGMPNPTPWKTNQQTHIPGLVMINGMVVENPDPGDNFHGVLDLLDIQKTLIGSAV